MANGLLSSWSGVRFLSGAPIKLSTYCFAVGAFDFGHIILGTFPTSGKASTAALFCLSMTYW